MAVKEPGQVIKAWIELFNAGDLEGLLSEMYEDSIVLLPGPGAPPVAGKDAVRAVLDGFLAMKGTMSLVATTELVNGDIALLHDRWRLEAPGSEAMEGTTADVVRRQADGTWKYILDNPFGGAVLDATA
jgi:uncharacterized protein (TIGR02246 family)